jgi:hypothetical protein
MTRVQFLAEAGIFLFATTLRLALGPTQLPIKGYWGFFTRVKKSV